jgi:single-strand DNA-binding protein
MIMFNKVFIVGNLTRDPELRRTSSGTPVTAFTIAVNRKTRGSDGNQKEDVSFVEIKAWEKTAEDVCRFLHKGRLVLVEGRIKQERWEAKDGGGPRSKVIVQASHVQFLDSPKDAKPVEAPAEEQSPDSEEMF